MLTHVVLMKFTDPADAPEARERLAALTGEVAAIRSMTVELDTVRGAVSYDLCMITEHESADGLRAYQEDPAHLEVAAWLRPRLAARASVDY